MQSQLFGIWTCLCWARKNRLSCFIPHCLKFERFFIGCLHLFPSVTSFLHFSRNSLFFCRLYFSFPLDYHPLFSFQTMLPANSAFLFLFLSGNIYFEMSGFSVCFQTVFCRTNICNVSTRWRFLSSKERKHFSWRILTLQVK